MRTSLIVALLTLAGGSTLAQLNPERDRAKPYIRTAWTFMREEAWADAAKAFQQAIDTDRHHEGAYYGLGLASMRLKNYPDAIAAYRRCRDLYRELAGKQFSNQQDAQRYRRIA
jgi:tetratricopeptide (TPR) repeat protein